MKKLIVLGIVVTMVMGLAAAASAFTQDTDWQLFFSLNNGVYTSASSQYGSAGADVKVGVAATASVSQGSSTGTSTYAYVRDWSQGTATGGFGLSANLKVAPATQTALDQVQEWTNIELWANSGYNSANLKFMIWATNISADGPAIQVICTQAAEGSGFTVGEIIYENIANSIKKTPGYTKDLTAYKSVYMAGSATSPVATFKVVSTTPALPVQDTPEPGSMVALFSGLVGLVGFGIRRRK